MKMLAWLNPKSVLIGLGALLGLIMLAVVALIAFFPTEYAIEEAERAIEEATGRDLEIAGPVNVTFWPALGVSAEKISLSNPEGFEQENFLTAENFVVAVAVLPLMGGKIHVKRLYLGEADLVLVSRADGAVNWTFPTAEEGEEGASLDDLSLEDVRLTGSRLALISPKGPPLEITNADASLKLTSLDDPLAIEAAFDYLQQRVRVALEVAAPRAVLEQAATELNANIRAPALSGEFDGHFDSAAGALDGRLNASGDSLRALMAWIGAPLAPGRGFERFAVNGAFKSQTGQLSLSDASFNLDQHSATGAITLAMPEDGVPRVTGTLDTPRFDANAYLPEPTRKTEGMDVDIAWSEDPIDLSGLHSVDANLDLSVGELLFQSLRFSDARMNLRLAGGAADARLTNLALYGGSGTARLIADARGPTPRIAAELNTSNVNAGELLNAAIGLDKLVGQGGVSLSLVGQGASQAALMRTLDGQAAISVRNGAWKGVNLGQVARTVDNVRSGSMLSGLSQNAESDTDFAEFAASFAVSDGVAATDDMRMLNPFVRLQGQGLINIGAQTIDMRITPRAVNSSQGQGGAMNAAGIGVPFVISGPWSNPSVKPDIGEAVGNELRRQASNILSRNSNNALGQLGASIFGQPGATATTQSPDANTDANAEASEEETAQSEQPAEPQTRQERVINALGGLLNRN